MTSKRVAFVAAVAAITATAAAAFVTARHLRPRQAGADTFAAASGQVIGGMLNGDPTAIRAIARRDWDFGREPERLAAKWSADSRVEIVYQAPAPVVSYLRYVKLRDNSRGLTESLAFVYWHHRWVVDLGQPRDQRLPRGTPARCLTPCSPSATTEVP